MGKLINVLRWDEYDSQELVYLSSYQCCHPISVMVLC